MDPLNEHYPQSCPFCRISTAYPAAIDASPIPHNPDPTLVSPQCHLILSAPRVLAFLDIMPMAPGHILVTSRRHYTKMTDLLRPSSTSSSSNYRARTRSDAASSRATTTTIDPSKEREEEDEDEGLETSRALGEWLPRVSAALCRVTGIEDWNIVQNNGARAAQVVPHIHFHLIPRYQEQRLDGDGDSIGNSNHSRNDERSSRQRAGTAHAGLARSWKMFGRGTREDLDDEEGAALAARLREALRGVLDNSGGRPKL